MRVLILTTQYLPHIGGSELAIANLTRRLPDVTFRIITSGVGGKWLLPVTGFLRGLRRDYDIIHAWQASYAGGAAWLLKLVFPRIPLIVTMQEGKDLARQGWLVNFFRRVILRKADVITVISRYLLEYGKKINPEAAAYLLPNGVDVEKFKNQIPALPAGRSKIKIADQKSKIIVSVSRLVPKNGLNALVSAMAFLPEYRLEVAGTGHQEQELKNLALALGVADRVSFLGNVDPDALPALLARSSVFVRPSRSEGLGNAFLEAMAAGVPVIGTPVGGIPDFLKDRDTGLFCRVDDPQSVADAIKEMLENNALREKIIASASQLVREQYDWDILAKQYHEIISRHSRL